MKNLPNILSSIRILLVPVFAAVFFLGGENALAWAAAVFLAAAVTDFFDGYLARKYGWTSDLGKILDPAGDKLMTLAMVICLSARGIIRDWIPWFFFTKEILMALGGLLLRTRVTSEMPASNIIGKTATFALFCVGLSLMLFKVPRAVAEAMTILAVLLSLAAFISYIAMFLGMIKENRSAKIKVSPPCGGKE